MEKITYQPLITHLKQSGDLYNQLYRDSEMRFGNMPRAIFTSWVSRVIQPVVAATSNGESEQVARIFSVLYKNLLALLGSQLGIMYEQEYQRAWLMMQRNHHLMNSVPGRMVSALNSAIGSIRNYQPAKVEAWISYMESAVTQCRTIEDFLKCGRIYAWLCGLAQLRTRAIADLDTLSDDLNKHLEKSSGITLDKLRSHHWISFDFPTFAGVAGGFAGQGGPFRVPPKVALINNQIVLSDNQSTCALFSDEFGSVLLTEISIPSSEVHVQSNKESFTEFQMRFGRLIPFEDVNAAVIKNNTLVFTRDNSFYVFIYGWHD